MLKLKQKLLLKMAAIGFMITAIFITACSSDDNPGPIIIKETDDNHNISVAYNSLGGAVYIVFDNTSQTVSIEIIDKMGAKILHLFEGIIEQGTNIHGVNPELFQSDIYFAKFIFQDEIVIRQVAIQY